MSKMSPQFRAVLRLELADAKAAYDEAKRDHAAAKTDAARKAARGKMGDAARDIERIKSQLPAPRRRE